MSDMISPDSIGIPMSSVHAAFLRREDIAPLAPEEQEQLWREHVEGMQPFLRFMAGSVERGDAVMVEVDPET